MTAHSGFLKNGSYKSTTVLNAKAIDTTKAKITRDYIVFKHNDNSIGQMDVEVRSHFSTAQ
jgi:hypothetical protein